MIDFIAPEQVVTDHGCPGHRRTGSTVQDHPLTWLLPAAVLLLYPLVEAFRMSFTNMSLIEPGYAYVGLDTFSRVFNSLDFWSMTRITLIFVGMSVVLRLGGDVVSFLSDGQMALLLTIVANTWRGTAFSMIILYTGLQQVPKYLQEATRIDGASPLQRFRSITIPLLMPVLFINLVLITIYTVNTFDMILALTGGGPGRATEVLALFMYFGAFNRFNLGTAAVIAVVMLLVNVVLMVVYIKYLLGEEEF